MIDQIIKILEDSFNRIITFDYIWYINQFFSSLTFESFLKLLVIYFFIVWIALIIWVIKDIINRTNNVFFQIFAILTVFIWTPLWIFIYLFIRPWKTLFEQFYEESELEEICDANIENKTNKPKKVKCFKCDYEISSDFKFCPNCRIKLKDECTNCKKVIQSDWELCPFCWKNKNNKVDDILNTQKDSEKKEDTIKTDKKNKKEKIDTEESEKEIIDDNKKEL